MAFHKISFVAVAVCALALGGCSESEADQRERLNQVADEVIALEDSDAMTQRMSELSEEDMQVFSEILDERMSAAQAQLEGNSALTGRMIQYAAQDRSKADQLVFECEAELGVSATGPHAPMIAECVDQRW